MISQQPFTIEQFYKFLGQHRLMAGKCLKCGKIHLPPRPLCDNCFSQQFEWVAVSGKGKLLTYTVISIAPEQFQALTPYAVGIVGLENGLKIPGMIQNATQQDLQIGMELNLDFGTCSAPQKWPQWPRYCFKF
jgi:uncharacterized OB-fold protein